MVGKLRVGDVAPLFVASDTEGQSVDLARSIQAGPVVLAFFPRAFTVGCTRELRSFQRHYSDLRESQAELFAVSTDKLLRQKEFRESLAAEFRFIADPEARICRMYGTKLPLVNYTLRRTLVIGTDGLIKRIDGGIRALDPSRCLDTCRNLTS